MSAPAPTGISLPRPHPPSAPPSPAGWRLSTFAGRFTEISGDHSPATLTLAFRLVLEAQRMDEPVAWISERGSVFYPPDAAETAVDLDALTIVRVPGVPAAARAADQLLRSGAFGLVVLDLGVRVHVPLPAQIRLAGLAKKHHAALLCLTEKERERPSIGSLVSIRADAIRIRKDEGRFVCRASIVKDKRRGPGWKHTEVCHGPDGLR